MAQELSSIPGAFYILVTARSPGHATIPPGNAAENGPLPYADG